MTALLINATLANYLIGLIGQNIANQIFDIFKIYLNGNEYMFIIFISLFYATYIFLRQIYIDYKKYKLNKDNYKIIIYVNNKNINIIKK